MVYLLRPKGSYLLRPKGSYLLRPKGSYLLRPKGSYLLRPKGSYLLTCNCRHAFILLTDICKGCRTGFLKYINTVNVCFSTELQ